MSERSGDFPANRGVLALWGDLRGRIEVVFGGFDYKEDLVTGLGEIHGAFALALVFTITENPVFAHHAYRLMRDQAAYDAVLRENVLSLGGPDTNPVTKTLINKLREDGDDLNGFTYTEHAITYGGTKYGTGFSNPERKMGAEVTCDHGIAVRRDNPFAPGEERACFLVVGCHTYGSYAAACLLTEPAACDQIAAVSKGRDFEAVVRMDGIAEASRSVTVVDARPKALVGLSIDLSAEKAANAQPDAPLRDRDYCERMNDISSSCHIRTKTCATLESPPTERVAAGPARLLVYGSHGMYYLKDYLTHEQRAQGNTFQEALNALWPDWPRWERREAQHMQAAFRHLSRRHKRDLQWVMEQILSKDEYQQYQGNYVAVFNQEIQAVAADEGVARTRGAKAAGVGPDDVAVAFVPHMPSS